MAPRFQPYEPIRRLATDFDEAESRLRDLCRFVEALRDWVTIVADMPATVAWKGRSVVFVFDSAAAEKPPVAWAEHVLCRELILARRECHHHSAAEAAR